MNQTSTWKPLVKRLDSGERERLKIAKELLRKKHHEEALVEFNAILENNPQSINALLGIGLVYLRQEHLDEALARFKQAKLLDPLQPKPYLLEGFVLLRQGNMAEAEQVFKAVLSLDSRSHRALLGLGEVFLSAKRYDDALIHLREALRYNPQLVAPRLLSAKIYSEQGKFDEAVGEIRTVLEIDPGQARAYFQLARLHASRNELGIAAEVLALAMEKLPNNNTSLYLKIGLLANDIKLYDISEKAFRALLDLQPNRLIVQIYLVEAMIGLGKFDEAEACLKKLPLNKQYAGLIHKLLGDIYYQRGQFQIAVEEYRATVLGVPELAKQFSELIHDADDIQSDDWENLAEIYQPSLAAVLTDQTDRLRELRARRRNQR